MSLAGAIATASVRPLFPSYRSPLAINHHVRRVVTFKLPLDGRDLLAINARVATTMRSSGLPLS